MEVGNGKIVLYTRTQISPVKRKKSLGIQFHIVNSRRFLFTYIFLFAVTLLRDCEIAAEIYNPHRSTIVLQRLNVYI